MQGPEGAQWAPDPFGRHEQRYWDGSQWTEHVTDGRALGIDPPLPGPRRSIDITDAALAGERRVHLPAHETVPGIHRSHQPAAMTRRSHRAAEASGRPGVGLGAAGTTVGPIGPGPGAAHPGVDAFGGPAGTQFATHSAGGAPAGATRPARSAAPGLWDELSGETAASTTPASAPASRRDGGGAGGNGGRRSTGGGGAPSGADEPTVWDWRESRLPEMAAALGVALLIGGAAFFGGRGGDVQVDDPAAPVATSDVQSVKASGSASPSRKKTKKAPGVKLSTAPYRPIPRPTSASSRPSASTTSVTTQPTASQSPTGPSGSGSTSSSTAPSNTSSSSASNSSSTNPSATATKTKPTK